MVAKSTILEAGIDLKVQLAGLQQDLERARTMTVRAMRDIETRRRQAMQPGIDRTKRQILTEAQQRQRAVNQEIRGIRRVMSAERERNALITARFSAMRTGGVMLGMAGAAVTGGVGMMVKQYADFDTAMRKATSVSVVSLDQFGQMSKLAEDASINLNMAATSTAEAFYFLGSAGLTATEQMQAYSSVVTLARAASIEAGQSAEILVDTMKGFKIPFSESASVSDQLTHAVISSNMTFLQMGETLSLVSGVARTTNNSLAETLAAIQLMANVGIKGTRSGTTLRRSLLNLAAPSSKISRLFRTLGIDIEEASGKTKPYITLIGELNESLKGASEGQQQMAFKTLFGARAIAGQLEVFHAGAEKMRAMAIATEFDTGANARVAEKQMKSLGNQIGSLKQESAALTRQLGRSMGPTIEMVTMKLKEWTEATRKSVDSNSLFLATLMNYITISGGVAVGLGSIAAGIGSLGLLAMTTGAAFSTLLIGATAVVAVLGVIIYKISGYMAKKAQAAKFERNLKEEVESQTEALKKNKIAFDIYRKDLESTESGKRLLRTRTLLEERQQSNVRLRAGIGMANREVDKTKRQELVSELVQSIPGFKPVMDSNGPMRSAMGPFGNLSSGSTPTMNVDKTSSALMAYSEAQGTAIMRSLDELTKKAPDLIAKNLSSSRIEKAQVNVLTGFSESSVNNFVQILDQLKGHEELYRKVQDQFIENRIDKLGDEMRANDLLDIAEVNRFKNIMLNLERERLEREKNTELAKRSDSFARGFSAQAAEMQRESLVMGEIGASVALTLRDSFSTALGDIARDARNWRDVMVNTIKSIENALIDLAAEQVATGMMSSFAGSSLGGMFGLSDMSASTAGATTAADVVALGGPPMTYHHSGGLVRIPRLHNGLKSDEFPAILQTGERVLSRGETREPSSGNNTPVNVNINITAMDSKSVFQSIKPLKKELASLIQSASKDNHPIRRG